MMHFQWSLLAFVATEKGWISVRDRGTAGSEEEAYDRINARMAAEVPIQSLRKLPYGMTAFGTFRVDLMAAPSKDFHEARTKLQKRAEVNGPPDDRPIDIVPE